MHSRHSLASNGFNAGVQLREGCAKVEGGVRKRQEQRRETFRFDMGVKKGERL